MAIVNVSEELAQGHNDSGFSPFVWNSLMKASHADNDPKYMDIRNIRGYLH